MINVVKTWLTDDAIHILTDKGVEGYEKFSDYPRLQNASKAQLQNFETDSTGIHWPELDEDLSFEGFFDKKPENILYRIFMAHPELNASAVARNLGISQSLFAQYISGAKRPSQTRLDSILDEIRSIGRTLAAV